MGLIHLPHPLHVLTVIDNDNDGLIDFPQDPGCDNADDNDEFNETQGGEGVTADVNINNDWGSGYCADVAVTNNTQSGL